MVGVSAADGNLDIAVAEPPYFERRLGVGDGFVADVLAGAVVNLPAGLFNHAEHSDHPAPRLQLTADQAHALEIQALALARRQQPAMAEVIDVARARPIGGELNVLALGRQLVEGDG